MSTPITERTRVGTVPPQRGAGRQATIPAQRASRTSARKPSVAQKTSQKAAAQKAAPKASQKAYARRDERLRRLVGGQPARGAGVAGRAPFALLLMGLLGVGLVATLWLSTAATADSYRLQDARTAARLLSSQSERLHREVASLQAAPELARRAASLGMVPVQDPARLVVRADGTVTVVGVPEPAQPKAPPVPPAPPVVAGPEVPPADGAAPAGEAIESTEDAASQDATSQAAASQDATSQAAASQDAASEDADGQDAAGQAAGQAAGPEAAATPTPSARTPATRAPGTRSPTTATPTTTTKTPAPRAG